MSEAELLAEHALRVDRIWEMAQWWASVTFAVLLAAHIGVLTLNRVIVAIMVFLYTIFSVFVVLIVRTNLDNLAAVRSSLLELDELTILGTQVVGEGSGAYLGAILFALVSVTYLSTVFYILYCLLGKSKSNGAIDE